jgi:F-type H+-transporting ATPase subunit a
MPMTALASGGGGEEHHGVDAKALPIFKIGAFEFTNSFLMAIIAAVLIAWFVSRAMAAKASVPSGKQNFVEMLVEFLYGQVENIVGKKVAPRAFPLLGSIFVFILVSNYMGLFPGVGTVGFGPDGHSVSQPFFRPSTADMNMTLAIALVSTVIWFWLSIAELGVGGFLAHTFGPKGGLKGALKYGLMPIFFIVGLIEVVGFCFRPVSLSFRLYGNIFAGENLLHTMSGLMDKTGPVGKFIGACALPIPFYFMELLVGLLQAMVFTLLMAVYIQLSTTHEDHGDHGHEEGHDDHGHGEKAAAH